MCICLSIVGVVLFGGAAAGHQDPRVPLELQHCDPVYADFELVELHGDVWVSVARCLLVYECHAMMMHSPLSADRIACQIMNYDDGFSPD